MPTRSPTTAGPNYLINRVATTLFLAIAALFAAGLVGAMAL